MAREYQFFLNSTIINDEPIGWDESKRKIVKNDSLRGLFVEYVNDLTFHGDGYDVIIAAIKADGFCADMNVDIYYRCSEFDSFAPYFVGQIKMTEVEIDEWKCTVRCNIEDRTIDGIVKNLEDLEVKFNTERTVSGEILTGISNTVTIRDTVVFATSVSRTGYRVFDAFQYILSYISDNQITFQSTFFGTTISDRATSLITFTNPGVDLVGAGNVVIVYKNAFNVTTTLTIPKQGTVAATLNYIISQFNFNATGTEESKFYVQDYKFYNNVTTNGTTTVTLVFDIPGFDIISTNVASTIVDDTTIANGMKNLVLMTGNQLRNSVAAATGVPIISFKELFEEMNKIFNLGMSITTVLGVTTLRIEPISFFFDTTGSPLVLDNIVGLKRKNSKDFSKGILNTGDGSNNIGATSKQTSKTTWIVDSNCREGSLDLRSKYIVDSSELYEQQSNTLDTKDEKIFLFECETGSLSTIRYHNIIYSTTAAAFISYYAYNAHLTNFWKVINWFFNTKGDMVHENYTMTNTALIKVISEYEFDYSLTFDQQEQIKNNRTLNISFSSSVSGPFYSGFIKQIETLNRTGKSQIKLYTTTV